jgi:uncharacterized protein (TIRG00374 family)
LSKKLAGLFLGLGISALAFWWAIPEGGLRSLPGYLASANPSTLLLAVVVATATFPIRALRWRLLLRSEDGTMPSWHAAWHATAIGFMANNVLPFRLGEVIRGVAVARLGRTSVPAALASIAVERVFDALAVVALFAIVLSTNTLPTEFAISGRPAGDLVRLVALAGLGALAMAVVAALYPERTIRLIRTLVPWRTLAEKLAGIFEGFAHGLRVLHDPKRVALAAVGSLVLWAINAWSFGLAFQAFGLPGGPAESVLLQTFVVFAVAVPSSPGFIGVIEYAMQLAGKVIGVPEAASLAAALTYHILTFIPITLLGAWSLYRTGLKLGELRTAESGEQRAESDR